jgi:hypothetical protein
MARASVSAPQRMIERERDALIEGRRRSNSDAATCQI